MTCNDHDCKCNSKSRFSTPIWVYNQEARLVEADMHVTITEHFDEAQLFLPVEKPGHDGPAMVHHHEAYTNRWPLYSAEMVLVRATKGI